MSERDIGLFGTLSCHRIHSICIKGDKVLLKQLIGTSQTNILEANDCMGKTPLIYAVINNHVECVALLLKAGARVDNSDNSGQTALHWSAFKGHCQCVKALLERGAAWYQKDLDGVTPLHLSARHKNPKCLQIFLQAENQHGNYDVFDSATKTALHWSASVANYEHVKLLLKKDANVNYPDVERRTPLHWAAACNKPRALDCVKLLLAASPSVLDWQDFQGKTALHLAVIMGTNEVVDALAVNGKALDLPDDNCRTPLHWAALLGFSDKTCVLLDRRANSSSVDGNGATPLHYAAQGDHADTVSAFLSRSYVQDVQDNFGCSAFLWAAAKGAINVLKVMQQHGANMKDSDKHKNTALHAASLQGHTSTVQWLIDQGCNTEAENDCGQTPLLLACQVGRAKIIRVLLANNKTALHAVDMKGFSALHCATIGGHAYICQMLVQYGIDPNIKDFHGLSPLHYASYKGYLNCMSVLLENKANPNYPDNLGQTPLHWACMKGKIEAVKLLHESGAFLNSMARNLERSTPLDNVMHSSNNGLADYLLEHKAESSEFILNFASYRIQAFMKNYFTRSGSRKNEFNLDPMVICKWKMMKTTNLLPTSQVLYPCTPPNNLSRAKPITNSQKKFASRIPVRFGSVPNRIKTCQESETSMTNVIYISKIDLPPFGSPINITGCCLGCHKDVAVKTPLTKFQREEKNFNRLGLLSPRTVNLKNLAAIVIQRAWRRYNYRKVG